MGSCISCSGNSYIIKIKPNNKSKKSSGCFTSLCKGENNIDLEIENKNPSQIVIPQIKSSYIFYHKNDKLNTELNIIIEKYKNKIQIQKINFEQLYNIFMSYAYDFTKSNFIILDTRELAQEKTQLFLKKFPQINYNIKQLVIMKKEKINKFFKFLKNKNIIFILKNESSIDILEKYLIFFISNDKFNFKNIYILSQYIQTYNESNTSNIYEDYLYYFIDEDLLYNTSLKILVNTNDIKSSYLNISNFNPNIAYIFYDIFPHIEIKELSNIKNEQIINKYDINYLSDKNILDNDIFLNFIYKFKIGYIMNFLSLNEFNNYKYKNNFKYITHRESKRNKLNKEDKINLLKQNNIYIPKNIEFDEFYKIIHNDFIPLVEEYKEQILQNNCILIQFDNDIDNLFVFKLIFIIIFRITGLKFDNIYNYLKSNFFELGNESFINIKKDEIFNFLL